MAHAFADFDSILLLTPEAATQAAHYMAAKVVPDPSAEDADHVAAAVVHNLDMVVSWNFRHPVNVHLEKGLNAVNLLESYPPVSIVNPLGLIFD